MEYCASELTPGATALVMLAKEDSEDALDAQFDETCIIYRWDADEVNAEVERGEALRDSLAAETRKQLREARKEARKAPSRSSPKTSSAPSPLNALGPRRAPKHKAAALHSEGRPLPFQKAVEAS